MAWTLIIRSVLKIVKKRSHYYKEKNHESNFGFSKSSNMSSSSRDSSMISFRFLSSSIQKIELYATRICCIKYRRVFVVRAWFRAYYFSILVNIIFFSTATRTYLVHLQFVWGSFTNNSTGREGWKSSKNWVCGWTLSSNCSVCHLFYNAKFKILIL